MSKIIYLVNFVNKQYIPIIIENWINDRYLIIPINW
jgi:hypothetical protein